MDAALIFSGLAMGVVASPHCALMCSAPCAALTGGRGRNAFGFHLGRVLGYMGAGALAASSVAALGAWSHAVPALRPVWMLVQLAFFGLGLWWLVTGRSPQALKRAGAVPLRFVDHPHRALRSGLAGLGWVAWPCAALQSALLLSALASDAPGGALVMAGFAIGSMPALAVAPWAWARWSAARQRAAGPNDFSVLGYRLAGVAMLLSAGWSLTHGLWQHVAAWCLG